MNTTIGCLRNGCVYCEYKKKYLLGWRNDPDTDITHVLTTINNYEERDKKQFVERHAVFKFCETCRNIYFKWHGAWGKCNGCAGKWE